MSFSTLVLAPFSQQALSALERHGRTVYEPWTETQTLYDPEGLGRRLAADDFQGLVVEADFLFEELFAAASSLRFAAICRGALNHVDLDAATENGVAVVHTPGRNAQAVAELVLALVLGLARRLPHAESFVRNGEWQDPLAAYLGFQGRELLGATLGVIGLGQIGQRVASLGLGIGMRVLGHDPYLLGSVKLPEAVTMVDLEDLLRDSDFVTLHVPDSPSTERLLDAQRIGRMRKGAYLVNVTSPAVIDQPALAHAVKQGHLGGVALDVHESHPLPPNSPLLALARAGHNVLLTPHIGGATMETVERHSRMVLEDLEQFLGGRRPERLANPEVWQRLRAG